MESTGRVIRGLHLRRFSCLYQESAQPPPPSPWEEEKAHLFWMQGLWGTGVHSCQLKQVALKCLTGRFVLCSALSPLLCLPPVSCCRRGWGGILRPTWALPQRRAGWGESQWSRWSQSLCLKTVYPCPLSVQNEILCCCCSVTQLCLTLWPHGRRHTRLPCPSLSPRVCSNSCPLSRWCHPSISSSVIPFSTCPQSFPASGSFPVSWLFAPGGQSTGASASASVLPMNI